MSNLEFTSDFRQRATVVKVNEAISVSYDLRQKTGCPVEGIVGSISKNGIRIGAVSVDRNTNSFYVSFEKFDAATLEERGAIFTTVNQNVEEILKLD